LPGSCKARAYRPGPSRGPAISARRGSSPTCSSTWRGRSSAPCFDYILLEDSSYVGESFGGSTEVYLKNAIAVPRQDPSVVAALMTQVTSKIGIVPTFGTYAYHPYLLARLVATLDQVSGGRIGWNAVTGSSDYAAMNFGMQGMPEHDTRYDMADEYMEVVRKLWGRGSRARSSPTARAACWSILQGPCVNYPGQVFQHAWAVEFRPRAAGPAGDRPGRRLAARPQVRRGPCRDDRGQRQGHRRDARLSRRRAQAHGRPRAASPATARCCS
jgi:alkanesulfonate monooxygenase SsuD/methylene tetrahydromethanopterin reductase-like flavin-dependent oxidoreductase (luciferase family)